MKKIIFTLFIIFLNIIITYLLLYFFIFSKNIYIENWIYFSENIIKKDARIIIWEKAEVVWDIILEKWEIIFKNNSKIKWNIFLKNWKILIEKNVNIFWNIETESEIEIWENSKIEGNIWKKSLLKIDSSVKITWKKPKLFAITDFPDFMKYFLSLPENHRDKFWYIYLTSHNMDIRWRDLEPKEYFLEIFFFENWKLKKIPENKKIKFYENSKKFINSIPERNVSRFWVWFVTKTWAYSKKPDMYLSKNSLSPELFMHEYWHILDYNFDFSDFHNPVYPYKNKENSLTEYWKFHIWEDFAEGYRFYVMHSEHFKNLAKNNSEIEEKYNYFKKYVFNNYEFD